MSDNWRASKKQRIKNENPMGQVKWGLNIFIFEFRHEISKCHQWYSHRHGRTSFDDFAQNLSELRPLREIQ